MNYNKLENVNGKYFEFNFGIKSYSDLFVFVNGKHREDVFIFPSSIDSDKTKIYFPSIITGTIEGYRISDAEESAKLEVDDLTTYGQIGHLEYIYELLRERKTDVSSVIRERAKAYFDPLKIYIKSIYNVTENNLLCNGQLIKKSGATSYFDGLLEEVNTSEGTFYKLPDLVGDLNRDEKFKPYILKNYWETVEPPVGPPPVDPPDGGGGDDGDGGSGGNDTIPASINKKILDVNTIDLLPNTTDETKEYFGGDDITDINYRLVKADNNLVYLIKFKVIIDYTDALEAGDNLKRISYIDKNFLEIYEYNENIEGFTFVKEVDLVSDQRLTDDLFTLNKSDSPELNYHISDPLYQDWRFTEEMKEFDLDDIQFIPGTNDMIIPFIGSRRINNQELKTFFPSIRFNLIDNETVAQSFNCDISQSMYDYIYNLLHPDLINDTTIPGDIEVLVRNFYLLKKETFVSDDSTDIYIHCSIQPYTAISTYNYNEEQTAYSNCYLRLDLLTNEIHIHSMYDLREVNEAVDETNITESTSPLFKNNGINNNYFNYDYVFNIPQEGCVITDSLNNKYFLKIKSSSYYDKDYLKTAYDYTSKFIYPYDRMSDIRNEKSTLYQKKNDGTFNQVFGGIVDYDIYTGVELSNPKYVLFEINNNSEIKVVYYKDTGIDFNISNSLNKITYSHEGFLTFNMIFNNTSTLNSFYEIQDNDMLQVINNQYYIKEQYSVIPDIGIGIIDRNNFDSLEHTSFFIDSEIVSYDNNKTTIKLYHDISEGYDGFYFLQFKNYTDDFISLDNSTQDGNMELHLDRKIILK